MTTTRTQQVPNILIVDDTPANLQLLAGNGVLGIGHLAINLCQLSPEHTVYAALFEQSSLRLLNLIEDATLIPNIGQITRMTGTAISFPDILDEVAASLPDIRISIEPATALRMFLVRGHLCATVHLPS